LSRICTLTPFPEKATPGQQGYICGRIWFEAFATALPFTKLGKLPQLAKVAVLERLEASGLLKSVASAAVASEKAGLLISKMCFVAGTLVLTKAGPMRIEEVKTGTWVWSRNEHSTSAGWKRVVQTFSTHPNVIHRLTYELRGPPRRSS
jgi:hypothetical protein